MDDVWRPIFGISLLTVSPGADSLTKALTPRAPGPPVRAKMTKRSAKPPLVIQCLDPEIDQPPPSARSARVRRDAVSDPASGSVSA